MAQSENRLNLDELSTLVDTPRRTVRYYIQRGLIDPPLGVGRGSHYDSRHIEQLLEIRKWQNAGVSLERIAELLSANAEDAPPPRPRQAGDVAVWSHITVAEGVEVLIDPQRAGLSPDQVRSLAAGVTAVYQEVVSSHETKECTNV